MMVVALFGATHPAEKFFRPISASAIHRIGLFAIDALHFILGVQRIPRVAYIGEGATPHTFVLERRLARARELLTRTAYPK
jgi:hypothetical protein